MKRAFILSLLTIPALAQEFHGPTDKDLMAVSFHSLKESKKALDPNKDADCKEKNKNILSETKITKPPTEEVVCLCELGREKQTLLSKLVGDVEYSEIKIESGNDNFLHGVLQLDKDYKKHDGDDRGRTFNVGTSYELHGSEGNLFLKYDSTGFGKFNPQNGYRKDSEGRYYLNYHDVDSLDFRLDKYFEKSEKHKTYGIGEISLFHETEEGSTSRELQEWWHHSNNNLNGHKTIQYHYLKENDDKTTVRVMGGIGREWIADIGNWKCATKAEMKLGLSGSKSSMSPEIAARLQSTISHSSAEWIALSTWTSASAGFLGKGYEGGVNLSFPMKNRNFTVVPFIGIERHRTDMDNKYGKVSGNAFENYHVFGVTIKY